MTRVSDVKNTESSVSEADDFWSLDSLLPPKKGEGAVTPSFGDISFADIEIENGGADKRGEVIPPRTDAPNGERLSGGARAPTETGDRITDFEKWLLERQERERKRELYGKKTVLEYSPGGRRIKKVTVSEETGRRAGGERFISDGQALLGLSGSFSENVPFESFYPQYSQLTAEQRACYIGFRTEVKSGRYPSVSRSYIYLYLYELINFASRSPNERAEAIASLIAGYPDADERLFSDMCDWLTDMCLIYGIKIPSVIYGDVFERVLRCARIKEVFLDLAEGECDETLAFMLAASKYDYKKSKFYPEFKEYYDKYIPAAVCAELRRLATVDPRFSDTGRKTCTVTRESYFGAFCTSAARRTVSVELRCMTEDETVRKTVSDAVKYAENRLRVELMIKPRLSVIYLPVSVREGIKSYFNVRTDEFPKKRRASAPVAARETPEYEKLYEPKETGISEETARRIEAESWKITERLVASLDNEENACTPPELSDENEVESEPKARKSEDCDFKDTKEIVAGENDAEGRYISALSALISGDGERFKSLARESGTLPTAFADMINEFFFELIGDSLISSDGDGFSIIADYAEDAKAAVNEYRKREV